MENSRQAPDDNTAADSRAVKERLVYIVPAEPVQAEETSLADLWGIIWQGKLLIVVITALFAVVATTYALIVTEWYRVDVLLAPAEDRSSQGLAGQLGGLGGLVGLAGISVGAGKSTESIAVLQSRDFTRSFITDRNLLGVILADDWDADTGRWKAEAPEDQPDIRDAIRYFHEHVRSVTKDNQTGLITLRIEWTDPKIAAEWATDLVTRLNNDMRRRALEDAERNIGYLQGELAATNVATLRESIGSLLETELQKLMLAKGNEEFAFRVVDGAQEPKERERPRRVLIVALAVIIGGNFAVIFVFIRHGIRRREVVVVGNDKTANVLA